MHLNTVSIGAASTYIPSNCAKAFLSLHVLFNSCYFFFLIKAFLEDMRSSHCGFDLYFLMINSVEHVFMYLLASCMYSLKKCLFRFSAHFKKNRLFVFCCWVVWVPCVFWIIILTRNIICKYFLQFHRLPFHFVDGFLNWAEAF